MTTASTESNHEVPVIDLSDPDEASLAKKIAEACSTYGFFQVTSHGIPLEGFREEMKRYFALPHDTKVAWKRNQQNSRGFFDDELTKQKRDWKECLDFGVPGSRDWTVTDHATENACLDGYNRFPSEDQLPKFRSNVIDYFEKCTRLSDRLAILMAKGLLSADSLDENCTAFLTALKEQHTSYLRMNYYPPCSERDPLPLGIYPHRDAGFLTVLIQDDDCHSLQVWHDNQWHTVHPEPGALTINTGDMAMIWSNGTYKAPLHRVLTDPEKTRYSAPFFYNPGYDCWVKPHVNNAAAETALFEPCLWGYFRAVRFAGDLTDLGVEIQTEDYKRKSDLELSSETVGDSPGPHLAKQRVFAEKANLHQPFSVETYRPLLVMNEEAVGQ